MFKTFSLSLRKFVMAVLGVLMLTPHSASHAQTLEKMGIIILPENSVKAATQPTKPTFQGTCRLY